MHPNVILYIRNPTVNPNIFAVWFYDSMWLWYLRTLKWECFAWSCFSHSCDLLALMNHSQAIRSCFRLYLFLIWWLSGWFLILLMLKNNLNLNILYFLDRSALNSFYLWGLNVWMDWITLSWLSLQRDSFKSIQVLFLLLIILKHFREILLN